MTAAHAQHYEAHRKDYGLDIRLNLMLGRRLKGFDYVHAQRHRARDRRPQVIPYRKPSARGWPGTPMRPRSILARALPS